jgi:hypothetical protein
MPAHKHPPKFIVCQRRACGCVKQVKSAYYQRRSRYCSRRCAALDGATLKPAAVREGIERSAVNRKRRYVAQAAGLTPIEAFRKGYMAGLRSKLKQIRRRFQLVPLQGAHAATSPRVSGHA